mgnify:CR=1 FL=1
MVQNTGLPHSTFNQKNKKDASEIKSYINRKLAEISRRVKIVEEHLDTMSSRLQLTEKDTIEKHKSSIKRVNTVEREVREMRGKIREVNDLSLRLADRLKDFAPREDIQVLERYAKWWQPLNYVTREEVKKLIKEATSSK